MDEIDDSFVVAVMDGRKTFIAETVADYYQPYGEYGYRRYESDLIEVYDLKHRLRCIVQATKVYTIKFGNISAAGRDLRFFDVVFDEGCTAHQCVLLCS